MKYSYHIFFVSFLLLSFYTYPALSRSSADSPLLVHQLSDTKRIIVGRYTGVRYGYSKNRGNPITKLIFKENQIITKRKIKYRAKFKITLYGGVIPHDISTLSTSDEPYDSAEEDQGDLNVEGETTLSLYDESNHNSLQDRLNAEGIPYDTLSFGGTIPTLIKNHRYIIFIQKKKRRTTPIRAIYSINEFDEVFTTGGRPVSDVKQGKLVLATREQMMRDEYENQGVVVGEAEGEELGEGSVRSVTGIDDTYVSGRVLTTEAFISKIQNRIGKSVK